jgi:hypothetical protein
MADTSLLTPAPGASDSAPSSAKAQLEAVVNSGAKWFYWIAGLSLVNTALSFFGSDRRFVIGLGLPEVVDAIAKEEEAGGGVVNLSLDLLIVGMFVFFGYKACQRSKAAFLTGMIVYVLDAGLLLLGEEYFSVAFHGLALIYIFKGFSANNQLRVLESASIAAGLSPTPLKPE